MFKNGKLTDRGIATLQALLPDTSVLKKDYNGNLQLPHDLLGAIADQVAGKTEKWDKFVKDNLQKLDSWNDPKFRLAYPDFFKHNVLADKEKMIELIGNESQRAKEAVHADYKNLESKMKEMEKEVKSKQSGMSQTQVDSAVDKKIQDLMASGQWERLAKASTKSRLNYGLTRINHWSRKTGATVDGTVTSPNYVFPFMKQTWPTKQFRRVVGNPVPVPNPPVEALEKWEEHGDCWCSPAGDKDGYGPTLGVISTHQFYPDEVVIEHITPAASIKPGATPKNMELLAYIDDFETYDAVLKLSEDIFNDGMELEPKHEFHYIKIASWQFDMAAGEPVQAFPVQLDLKQFSAPITKLVVRAKDNWGKEDYTCLYRVRVHGDIVEKEK